MRAFVFLSVIYYPAVPKICSDVLFEATILLKFIRSTLTLLFFPGSLLAIIGKQL